MSHEPIDSVAGRLEEVARESFRLLTNAAAEASRCFRGSIRDSVLTSIDLLVSAWRDEGVLTSVLLPLLESGESPFVRVKAARYLLEHASCRDPAIQVLREYEHADHLGPANMEARATVRRLHGT